MITVGDIWRGVLPGGTELLAGGAGLERRVEWATSLRTKPPAFDSVKGGEIAFIPVRSIRLLDERLDLAQVMTGLAEKGGVAVAVLGDVSAGALAVADRMMLPLLRLPAQTSVSDLQHLTVRFILDQRTRLHEKEHELRLELTELALAGAGVAAIIDRLSSIVGTGAVWHDGDGSVRHRAGAVAGSDAELAAAMSSAERLFAGVAVAAADPPVRDIDDGQVALALAPIPLRDGVGGYICAVGPSGGISQLARIGVARAASAAAIELDRDRAVSAARDDIEGDVVDALVGGTYTSAGSIAERARRLGIELSAPMAVLVIGPNHDHDGIAGASVDARRDARLDRIVAAARRWVTTHLPGSVVTSYQGRLVVLVAEPPLDFRVKLAALLQSLGKLATGWELAGGAGGPVSGAAEVSRGYDQALQAAAMGRRIYGPGHAVSFNQMGLHRLLFAMAASTDLAEFRDQYLGRLRSYDQRSHSGLLETLEAYFVCHGSPTDIAQHLQLHRNTVIYRLRRIAEVGGLDLDDPTTRLCVQLGLRAGDVLDSGD